MDSIERAMAGVAGLLFGLALGSFAGMASWRIPRGEGFGGRSYCDGCGIALTVRDLVPVATWAVRRGKCRCGTRKLGWRYPLVEALAGLAGLAAGLVFGMAWVLVPVLGLVCLLAVQLLIDLEHKLLPDKTNLVLALLALPWLALMQPAWWEPVFGFAGLAAIALSLYYGYSALRGRKMLGGGDVKFMMAAGLWVGVSELATFLLAAAVSGIVFALVWRRVTGEAMFPFGPALGLGLLGTVLWIGFQQA